MAKINFEDKVTTRQTGLPRKNSFTADDANEIKTSVNELYENSVYTVELIDVLTVDFYPSNNIQIESVVDLVNSPVTTILVNDSSYTLGDDIDAGDKVTVSVSLAAVVKLNIVNI